MNNMKRISAIVLLALSQHSYPLVQSDKPIDAETLLQLVGFYLSDTPRVIEAGAYNGHDTKQLARLLPNGTIYAFEPVPQLYKELCESVTPFNNIKTINKALSDTTGTAQMHISHDPSKPESPSQSSSLLRPKDHILYAPQVEFATTLEVYTTTINDWAAQEGVTSVDILWLDMQGYELNALKAALDILPTVKVIVTEVEFVEAYEGQYLFNDVKSWLEEQGFEMIEIHYQSWFGDAIFINRKAINEEAFRRLNDIFQKIALSATNNLTTEQNDIHRFLDNSVDSQPVIE